MATKLQLQNQIDQLEMQTILLKDELEKATKALEIDKGKICVEMDWYNELMERSSQLKSLEYNHNEIKRELISRLTLIAEQSETINKLISKFVTFNQ
jgi:hypothetical protein